MNILSNSPENTIILGKHLGLMLKEKDVVALIGELGAGKTCFTKGLMKGLRVENAHVSSPTFVLMNRYAGRLPVYHFDVYRLNTPMEMVDLGYEEYFYGDGVSIVEWADKISKLLPKNTITVRFEMVDETTRRLKIFGLPDGIIRL